MSEVEQKETEYVAGVIEGITQKREAWRRWWRGLSPEHRERHLVRKRRVAAQARAKRTEEEKQDAAEWHRQWIASLDAERLEGIRETKRRSAAKTYNPAKQSAKRSLRRARERSAEGSYTAEEFSSLGNICSYCGVATKQPHADHDVPLSRGGTNWISNIVPACPTCNLTKNNLTGAEFRASERLKRRKGQAL